MTYRRSNERIVVRPPASQDEYREACRFTSERYSAAGYLPPGKTFDHPAALLLAVRAGAVIGSMGIVSGDAGRLPSERAFGFRFEDVVDASRASLFEGSRVATARGSEAAAYQGLFAAAFEYSRRRCDRPIWVLTMTRAHEILMRRHLYLEPPRLPQRVADASLARDFPAYWGAEPAPFAVVIERDAIDAALARLMPELETKVALRSDGFDHQAATYFGASTSRVAGPPDSARTSRTRARSSR